MVAAETVVVLTSRIIVAKNIVSCLNLMEYFRCITFALIWMVLENHFTIGLLEYGFRDIWANVKDLVVACHCFTWCRWFLSWCLLSLGVIVIGRMAS